ncbi:Hsp70 family protein [Peribacillus butanolivorans]|uniref:Hsp70 family protein n=1 Tax=Peribacillus butanolivorans TaxID=421767 RepID=UPI003670FB8A
MGLAVGIDLGTSNSSVAIYRRGKVESIPIEGKKILPSVVSFRSNNEVLVGSSAKSRLYIDPHKSVSSSKRFIGDKTKIYNIHSNKYTPVHIAEEILRKIKIESSKYLGEEVTDAVITIPAYFTDEQREETRIAGELAGFRVLRLLPEPTAAAIAYGLDKERNQTIMVYDLGGGTFDVSILKVENNSFKVIAVDGDSRLGGDDFDQKIVDFLLKKLQNSGSSEKAEEGSLSFQRIKEAAEEAKKELSESDYTDISIPDVFGSHIDEELNIHTFNTMIQPLLDRTVDKMNQVLQEAGLTKRDISRIILVGGSTRMKAVQEIVAANIKKPFIADNVDEIVAQGAAIMAANLSAPDIDKAPVPIEVQDVLSHSLGIALYDDDDVYKVFHVIKKNTAIPCKGAEMSFTRYPYQKEVELPVYRTESRTPIMEEKIGELVMPVTPSASPSPVASIFDIDEDGILTFLSAEISRHSDLFQMYQSAGKVNTDLLETMMQQNELKILQVTIDTKNRGVN